MNERRREGDEPEVMGVTTRGWGWEMRQSWFLIACFLTGALYWVPLVFMGLRIMEPRWIIYGLFYAGPEVLLLLARGATVDPGTMKSLWQATAGFWLFAAIHTWNVRPEYLLTISEREFDREEARERARSRGTPSGGGDATLAGGRTTQPARAAPQRALLNVNRLSEMELAMLPGMGPEGAQRALKLRAELGDFLSFNDFAEKMKLTPETRYRLEHLFEPDSGQVALAVAKDDPAYRKLPDGSRVLELNWAGAEALGTLPGMTPELAQRACSLREADGPFKSMEDFRFRLGLPLDVLVKIAPFAQCQSMSRGPAAAPKGGGRIVDV